MGRSFPFALLATGLLALVAFPARAEPTCALVGEPCSTVAAPPPPPSGPCLPDGSEWSSSPEAECCSGYGFGKYCACVPTGANAQTSCVECCSRTCSTGVTCGLAAEPPPPDGSSLRAAEEVRLSVLVLAAVVPSLLLLFSAG